MVDPWSHVGYFHGHRSGENQCGGPFHAGFSPASAICLTQTVTLEQGEGDDGLGGQLGLSDRPMNSLYEGLDSL